MLSMRCALDATLFNRYGNRPFLHIESVLQGVACLGRVEIPKPAICESYCGADLIPSPNKLYLATLNACRVDRAC